MKFDIAMTKLTKTKKTLPKIELPGIVMSEMKRCGKQNCKCSSGEKSDLHGPYYYRYWREQGRLKKQYVEAERVKETTAACIRRQIREKAEREDRERSQALIREMRQVTRNLEKAVKQFKIQNIWFEM